MAITWFLKDTDTTKTHVWYYDGGLFDRSLRCYEWVRPLSEIKNTYYGFKTKKEVINRINNVGLPPGVVDYEIVKLGTNKDTSVKDGEVKDNIGIPICRGDLLMPVQSSCTALNVRTCTVIDILKTPSGLIKIVSDITTFLLKNSPRIVVTHDILKTFENLADRHGN